jgi:hypothetical protein
MVSEFRRKGSLAFDVLFVTKLRNPTQRRFGKQIAQAGKLIGDPAHPFRH